MLQWESSGLFAQSKQFLTRCFISCFDFAEIALLPFVSGLSVPESLYPVNIKFANPLYMSTCDVRCGYTRANPAAVGALLAPAVHCWVGNKHVRTHPPLRCQTRMLQSSASLPPLLSDVRMDLFTEVFVLSPRLCLETTD